VYEKESQSERKYGVLIGGEREEKRVVVALKLFSREREEGERKNGRGELSEKSNCFQRFTIVDHMAAAKRFIEIQAAATEIVFRVNQGQVQRRNKESCGKLTEIGTFFLLIRFTRP
jgi:hypothetical protein